MDEIPARLQCAYCIRSKSHGGECRKAKYDDTGCLIFKLDSRGCIREHDFIIPLPLYKRFPKLHVWNDDWQYRGVATEIKIEEIYGIDWDSKKGNLLVICRCKYFVNEYDEKFKEYKDKEKIKASLKIIK